MKQHGSNFNLKDKKTRTKGFGVCVCVCTFHLRTRHFRENCSNMCNNILPRDRAPKKATPSVYDIVCQSKRHPNFTLTDQLSKSESHRPLTSCRTLSNQAERQTSLLQFWPRNSQIHPSSSFSNLIYDVCKVPPVFVTSFRVMAINCATALEDFFFQLFNSLAPELCIQRQTSQHLQSMTNHEQSCNLFKAREVKSSIGGLLLQMVWFLNEDRVNDEHNYKRTRVSTAKSSPFRPHLSSFLLRIVP